MLVSEFRKYGSFESNAGAPPERKPKTVNATATDSGTIPVVVPVVSHETIRTLRVSPSDLSSHPLQNVPKGDFLAVLPQPGLGSDEYVSAQTDKGWPPEQIVLEYHSADRHFERRWVATDRFAATGPSNPVQYRLDSDTSSTGYVTA
jgi:hypothetical protein